MYVLQRVGATECYVGQTAYLRRRLDEHIAGAAEYTRPRGPWKLVYYEAYASRWDALRRERMLKQHKKGLAMLRTRIMDSLDSVA